MSGFLGFVSSSEIWHEETAVSISKLSNTDASAQNVPSHAIPRILDILLDDDNVPLGATRIDLGPIPVRSHDMAWWVPDFESIFLTSFC